MAFRRTDSAFPQFVFSSEEWTASICPSVFLSSKRKRYRKIYLLFFFFLKHDYRHHKTSFEKRRKEKNEDKIFYSSTAFRMW